MAVIRRLIEIKVLEQLRIPGVGLISQNLADQHVSGITEMSYRECASKITVMTGQSISPMEIWKTIQALGEKVCEEEQELVKAHKAGKVQGETVTPLLFEETDGVYVKLQREQKKGGEIKVGIAYDGWKQTGASRWIDILKHGDNGEPHLECNSKANEAQSRMLEYKMRKPSGKDIDQKIGKGYRYPVSGHLKRLENSTGITHQTMLAIVGCCE